MSNTELIGRLVEFYVRAAEDGSRFKDVHGDDFIDLGSIAIDEAESIKEAADALEALQAENAVIYERAHMLEVERGQLRARAEELKKEVEELREDVRVNR